MPGMAIIWRAANLKAETFAFTEAPREEAAWKSAVSSSFDPYRMVAITKALSVRKKKEPAGAGSFSAELSFPVALLPRTVVLRVAVRPGSAGVRVETRHLRERRLFGRLVPDRSAFRRA